MSAPTVRVLSNYTGTYHDPDPAAIKTRLFFQLFHPVHWIDNLETAFHDGITTIVEFGGGLGTGAAPEDKRPNLESMIKALRGSTSVPTTTPPSTARPCGKPRRPCNHDAPRRRPRPTYPPPARPGSDERAHRRSELIRYIAEDAVTSTQPAPDSEPLIKDRKTTEPWFDCAPACSARIFRGDKGSRRCP